MTSARIWFADGTPAVEIDGTPDEPSDFHDTGPLDYIFSMLEMLNDGERNSFSMTDSAGEVFWFCPDEVITGYSWSGCRSPVGQL